MKSATARPATKRITKSAVKRASVMESELMHKVYLNGKWVYKNQAVVSVLDRGFIFGEGIYEVIPVYCRRPFRLAEHLRRLFSTLTQANFANPMSEEKWRNVVEQAISRAPWENQSIYLQVTRGADAERNHIPAANLKPTVFVMASVLESPSNEQRGRGVKAISAMDYRWLRCNLKTTGLMANCMLRQAAVAQGCVEAILFRDGFLTEGSATSIFIVKKGVLLAPPLDNLILPGITYDVVLELARAHNLPIEIRRIKEEEVRRADEVWLSSSTKEVLPVVMLDGKPIGEGRPGPMALSMYDWYQDFKDSLQ